MLYIVFTTGRCNLKCQYCGGSFPERLVPCDVGYSVSDLERFIAGDPEPVIAFYGGEPLLNAEFIKEVMKVPSKFVIQTNGTLARKLKPEHWLNFDAVLLSIDGRRPITDHYRGVKVHDQVVNSAMWLRRIGFRNDLIARMTVSELSDIFLDVEHVLSLNLFDHIHWQLDAVWNSGWKVFSRWCESSYMPGISRLIHLWVEEARKGRVLGLVPFISMIRTMIEDASIERPPCGAGLSSLSILPNGDVIACPIAVDVEWARLGNILRDSRSQMVGKVRIGKPCVSCDYLTYCGGRCLYTHYERLWGREGFDKICKITIHTIDELAKIEDEVLNLLGGNVISMEQLDYPLFNNTTEIIP